MAEKVILHSFDEIDRFVAEGGRITKLELTVNNCPKDKDPLDMTLRQFVVMTAESNAAVNTVMITLDDAAEPEAIFMSGLTPDIVRAIKAFSFELMAKMDAEEEGNQP